MTSRDDEEMTREQAGEPVAPPWATTYEQAQSCYRSTTDAQERFEELTSRDLTASAIAVLKARGTYDPHRQSHLDKYPPLTTGEQLEVLASGEMLARHYRHPALVHNAVKAGASWAQVAAATEADEAQVRERYRKWADTQHALHAYSGGTLGMDDAEHAAAITRAAEPSAGPPDRPAGQAAASHDSAGQPGTESDRTPASHLVKSRETPEPVTANAAVVSTGDKWLILAALDEAADNKRDRAANCGDCADQSCGTCQYRLQAADAYDHLAARLLGTREAGMSAAPDRPPEPDTGIHRQAAAEPEATAEREAGR